MHSAYPIVAHVVLIPLLFAALAVTLFVAFHLNTGGRAGHLDDPLDPDLVSRWNARTH